jgi:Domain of unknown function (DUF4431)
MLRPKMKLGRQRARCVARGGAAVVVLAVLLGAGASSAAACKAALHLNYNEPVTLEGVLKSGTGHHEVQGDFSYVYLALDKGICVDPPKGGGDEDFGDTGTEQPVDRIQMAGEASQQELPVGKRVTVKGKLFGAHTMWHAEEVLIGASSIEPK